ncbi:MAG: MerR family transcriptional regulator [Sphaerochaetaceae bacterium]|nr:MerR family transcriptional regulator [Sphaerochaetaceae bacterium]
MKRYKIGEISELSGLTLRTIRYYEEMGLLSAGRTNGGQRFYSDQDLVYLKRIIELKSLGFTLEEISRIIRLKDEDHSGNKRRTELLTQYRLKLSQDLERMATLQSHVDELKWHIAQLESAEDGFTDCPGAACAGCEHKDRCVFFKEK